MSFFDFIVIAGAYRKNLLRHTQSRTNTPYRFAIWNGKKVRKIIIEDSGIYIQYGRKFVRYIIRNRVLALLIHQYCCRYNINLLCKPSDGQRFSQTTISQVIAGELAFRFFFKWDGYMEQ